MGCAFGTLTGEREREVEMPDYEKWKTEELAKEAERRGVIASHKLDVAELHASLVLSDAVRAITTTLCWEIALNVMAWVVMLILTDSTRAHLVSARMTVAAIMTLANAAFLAVIFHYVNKLRLSEHPQDNQ